MTKKPHWKEQGVPFKAAWSNENRSWPDEYLEYPNYGAEWKPADDFEAILVVWQQERGQSAARVIFTEWETGTVYRMFLGDFVDMVKNEEPLKPGIYTGTWEFVKRGSNYGIKIK